jgi:hypothetical protein
MMRANRRRGPTFKQGLFEHPFFWLAVTAGISIAVLHYLAPGPESSLHGLFSLLWNKLGFGFQWMDRFLDVVMPGLERGLRIAFVALTGLLPYLVGDAIWQRVLWTIRNRR